MDEQEGPATIQGWLESYMAAIEQPTEMVQPFPDGWVRVPCPHAEAHPVDPRKLPPTFAVNVQTGLSRCPVCGFGGGMLTVARILRKFVPALRDADARNFEPNEYQPIHHDEINVRAFPSERKHFYRDTTGKAYCVAMSQPVVANARYMGDTVYAHRMGDRWLWGMGTKRLLYRSELLGDVSNLSMVMLVGNERSADAVQAEFDSVSDDSREPEGAATTWLGADASWRYTNMRATLHNSNLVLWPDQRQRSIITMLAVADTLLTQVKNMWFLDVGRSPLSSGHTPADALQEGVSMFDFVRRYGMKMDADSMPARRSARRYDLDS